MPVLAFGDAGLRDVDAYLTAVGSVDQFGKRATLVAVHLQVKHGFVFRQIAEIGREEALGEAVSRNLRNHQRLRQPGELMQQIYDFAECGMEGRRDIAVTAIIFANCFHSVEFAVVFFALEGKEHLLHEVIDVK